MRIPTYENQVSEQPRGSIAPVNPASPPPGAFGTQVAAANENLGNTISQVGGALHEHLIERERIRQESEVLAKDTDARKEIQNLLTDPRTNDQGVPNGLLHRNLSQAQGATQEFDNQFKALQAKYVDSVSTPYQKQALSKMLDNAYITHRDNVATHEANEENKNHLQILEANKDQHIIDAAGFTNPKDFVSAVKEASYAQYSGLKRMGVPDEKIAVELDKMQGEMANSAMNTAIASNPYTAQKYFDQIKPSLSPKQQTDTQKTILVAQRQYEELLKFQKQQVYDANLRDRMLKMFDGSYTLSEAQRDFKNDVLDKSDYDLLESKLVKPDYTGLNDPLKHSDPTAYNAIRDAQLSGKSPGEISRMIAKGGADGTISPTDGPFLDKLTKDMPTDPRDAQISSQGSSVKDFGNRYFAESFLGLPIHKEKSSQEVDSLLNDFYSRVDKEHASGERIDEIANQVMGQFIKKKYPEVSRLEDIPHVVIGIDGKVQRLLNPGQKTKLKGKYKIVKQGQE